MNESKFDDQTNCAQNSHMLSTHSMQDPTAVSEVVVLDHGGWCIFISRIPQRLSC